MSYYLLDHPNPNTEYPQYRSVRRRWPAVPTGTIIMHTAQGWGAHAVARFIASRTGWGSYHRLCDWDNIIKMVPFSYETWQDSETNPWGIGISAAVYAEGWDGMDPDKRDRTYRNLAACAAEAVTYMRATHGVIVPLHRITGAEARSGVPGFCAHGDSGLYRTDPGVQFDWNLFFDYTRQALSGGINHQSTTTTEEDDMFTDEDRIKLIKVVDDAHRGRAVVDSIEEPLHAKLLRVNRWIKAPNNPSIFELVDGKLRGISALEWKLLGRPTPAVFTQAEIDAMPKVEV